MSDAVHGAHPTHSARITGTITFKTADGLTRRIPVGPCLIEELDGDLVDIVWGRTGERSAVLPTAAAIEAERDGKLVMLD